MKKRKIRISFTLKYIVAACILLLAISIVSSVLISKRSQKEMTEKMHMRMLDIANTAAMTVDGDALKSITAEDVATKSPAYQKIYDELSVYQVITELTYIYTVKATEDEKTFIFVIDTDPDEPAVYGEKVVYTDALYDAGQGRPAVDKVASKDRWGRYYSAFCPVYDSSDNIAGIIGIDYSAVWYEQQVKHNALSHVLTTVVSLAVGCILILLVTAKLRKRLDGLYKEASALATDVEGLTKEISVKNENYREEDGDVIDPADDGQDVEEENQSSDAVEALALKIRSMQDELKKYNYYVHSRAYTDTMTGVGNKTAYFDTVRDLNKKISDGTARFVVVFCDINGLKNINDNFGHELGDIIISDAASVLKCVFDPKNIFRIGGDEFIVVQENITEKEMEDRIKALEGELAVFNEKEREYGMKLTFSHGIGVFDPNVDTEFRQVFKRADESMYRNKARYYKKNGLVSQRRNAETTE